MAALEAEADALWRAAVYASVCQLHLRENVLLAEPLRAEHVKERPAGHWGTVPGTAWALAHVALAGDRTLIPLLGADHAGVVQLAMSWLTGELARLRPEYTPDACGLAALSAAFPDAGGLGAEVVPGLAAGDYMGGRLGGCLPFAQGAALGAPDRILVPVIGDGECETPTTAAAWLARMAVPSAKVLPVIHLNGFRMGAPSLLSALDDEEIRRWAAGLGWEAAVVRVTSGSLSEHAAYREVLLGMAMRVDSGTPAMVILRCVKGWGGPETAGGKAITGTALAHKTPLAAAPDHPVYVQELYDRAVLNSAALARCGWDGATADPPGGRLLRDPDGALTGEVTGIGAFAVPTALAGGAGQAAEALEEEIGGTAAMMAAFAEHGLTGVVDAGGMATTPRDYDALYELWRRGGLTLRTRLFMCTWTLGNEVGDYAQLTTVGQPDFGDAMLKVSGAGEMPHSGCHDFEGLNPEFEISDASHAELLEITRLCANRGWRISVHAVLDRSLARVLDAWEQVERETGRISRLRCSIVHADGASEASLRRVAALRAGVLVQDRLLLKGADYVRAWGQEAANAAPRLGLMRQLGIPVGGGTDATRANWYSPWASIWWLVTGRSIDGATQRHERDRLSRRDAIASYTRDAAWFTGEDGWRGRLSPGYDADLCVPTADPFACAEDELRDLRSDLTMVGGQVTHAGGGLTELAGPELAWPDTARAGGRV